MGTRYIPVLCPDNWKKNNGILMGTHFLGFPGRYDACYIILGMGEFGTMENMGQPFNRRMFIMWISTQPQSEDGEHGNLRGYDHLSRFPERES